MSITCSSSNYFLSFPFKKLKWNHNQFAIAVPLKRMYKVWAVMCCLSAETDYRHFKNKNYILNLWVDLTIELLRIKHHINFSSFCFFFPRVHSLVIQSCAKVMLLWIWPARNVLPQSSASHMNRLKAKTADSQSCQDFHACVGFTEE